MLYYLLLLFNNVSTRLSLFAWPGKIASRTAEVLLRNRGLSKSLSAHLKEKRIGPRECNEREPQLRLDGSMHVRVLHRRARARARSRKRNPGECLDYHLSLYRSFRCPAPPPRGAPRERESGFLQLARRSALFTRMS